MVAKAKDTESKELAPRKDLPLVPVQTGALQAVLAENMGQAGISEFDLDRVKIPAGGGTSWNVPTLDGEIEVKEIEGVIMLWRDARAFWANAFSGEGSPPDCFSDDGIKGQGTPGGACAECPFAQWGSAGVAGKESRGQACKQMRLLFVLRAGDVLPLVVALPPTSIAPVKKYFLRLASAAIPYWGTTTKLSLERTKNGGGIAYSRAVATKGQTLSTEEIKSTIAYREALRPAMEKVRITDEDYAVEAG